LIETLGGKPTPGAGFACGIERMIIVAEKNGFSFPQQEVPTVYMICLDSSAASLTASLLAELRRSGISCDTDYMGRSFKAQMREANKLQCSFVYIIGPDEITKETGILKNMKDSSQQEIKFTELVSHFQK
jgi:histidyl-tRNA synthetase